MAKRKKPYRKISETKVQPAPDNLTGFFALLLKIDQRNNPNLYKTK